MTDTTPLCTCGHPAVEHTAGPTPLCIVCPDEPEQIWRHPYTPDAGPATIQPNQP